MVQVRDGQFGGNSFTDFDIVKLWIILHHLFAGCAELTTEAGLYRVT